MNTEVHLSPLCGSTDSSLHWCLNSKEIAHCWLYHAIDTTVLYASSERKGMPFIFCQDAQCWFHCVLFSVAWHIPMCHSVFFHWVFIRRGLTHYTALHCYIVWCHSFCLYIFRKGTLVHEWYSGFLGGVYTLDYSSIWGGKWRGDHTHSKR